MAELVTAEEAEKISEEVEIRPKKRKVKQLNLPQSLESLSGREVIDILEFLHRKYLSWMTEAEGAKYGTLYRQVREDALKETLEVYTEIQKQNQELINKLTQLTDTLQKMVGGQVVVQQVAEEAAKATVQEVKRSILDDPRVRALLYIVADYMSEKAPGLKKYLPFIQAILLPESVQQQETSEPTDQRS